MSPPCDVEPPRKRGRHSDALPSAEPAFSNTQIRHGAISASDFIREDLVDDSSEDPDFQVDLGTSEDECEHPGSSVDGDNYNYNGRADYCSEFAYSNSSDDDMEDGQIDGNHDENPSDIGNKAYINCQDTGANVRGQRYLGTNNWSAEYLFSGSSNAKVTNMADTTASLHHNMTTQRPDDFRMSSQVIDHAPQQMYPIFDVDDLDSTLDEDEQDDPPYQYSDGGFESEEDFSSSEELPLGLAPELADSSNPSKSRNNSQCEHPLREQQRGCTIVSTLVPVPATQSVPRHAAPFPQNLSTPLQVASSSAAFPSSVPNVQKDENDDDDPDDPDYQVNLTEADLDELEHADFNTRSDVNNAHYIEFLTSLLTNDIIQIPPSAPVSTTVAADPPSIDTIVPSGSLSFGRDYGFEANPRRALLTTPSVQPHNPTKPSNSIGIGQPSTDETALDVRDAITQEIDGQDDDDDFDYLRESARVRDDPLEYRDDFTVPYSEVLQLLSQPDVDSCLRPQTRARKPIKKRAKDTAVNEIDSTSKIPAHDVTHAASAVVQKALPPQSSRMPPIAPFIQPSLSPVEVQPAAKTVPSTGIAGPAAAHDTLAREMLTPGTPCSESLNVAFVGLSTDRLAQLQLQLAAFAQIASHVHTKIAKKYREASGLPTDNLEGSTTDLVIETRSSHDKTNAKKESDYTTEMAYKRSESMLRRFVKQGKVSLAYHCLVREQMQALRPMSERALGTQTRQNNHIDSWRRGVLNSKMIEGMDNFLRAVRSKNWDCGDKAMRPLKRFWRADITKALTGAEHVRKPSDRGRDGAPPWNAGDDNLLGLTIAKYGRDFGESSKDLLPHREEEDCRMRVRYLSSRRCGDNAVKRQVLLLSLPLRPEEMRLIEEGAKRYGNLDDCETWKRIQREFLPGRDWLHLQKVYNWRMQRRKYKASYRAKLSNQDEAPVNKRQRKKKDIKH